MLECPKSGKLITPNTDNDVEEKGTLVSLLVGVQNGTAMVEDSSKIFFHKTKHTLTICFSQSTPWYLPKGVDKLCPHKTCI